MDYKRAGIDTNHQPVRLGERDSDDYLVGYIDNSGNAWESRHEYEIAIGTGKLVDAIKHGPGGAIAAAMFWCEHEVAPENLPKVYRDVKFWLFFPGRGN